jgi:hypothetical protein
MGQTITRVGTSITRVIEDDNLPDSLRSGVTKAIFKDGDLPEYLIDELTGSLAQKAERMYRYAQDNYLYGLPSGRVVSSTQGRQQVEAAIEASEGQQVLMEYSHWGPVNVLHVGWMKLVAQYGYTASDNQLTVLSAQKNATVYLKDMRIAVPAATADTIDSRALEQWGIAPNAGYTMERPNSVGNLVIMARPSLTIRDPNISSIQLQVTVVYRHATTQVVTEETFVLTTSGYSDTANYFHAKYKVGQQTKWWIYEDGTGTYPLIDAVYAEAPAVSGSYFPFMYFRYDKQSVISNTTSPAYIQTKKMTGYLGMDFDTVAQAIDDNPDIADVEHAILTFAVPAVSTNYIENQYLFEYFDNLYYSSEITEVLNTYNYLYETSTQYNIVIKDARFRQALGHDGIIKRLKAGTVGGDGKFHSEKGTAPLPIEYVDENGALVQTAIDIPVYFYRKQIAPGLMEELEVRNLKMVYWIWNEYYTTTDLNEEILLVPLDRSITQNYMLKDREILYARSMHLVFNSRVVTKVKWYQTGVFRAVMLIIAVVITIYSWGTTYQTVGLALGLTGPAAVIATIVVNLVVGRLISLTLGFVARKLGAEVAIAIAILALIVGGYQIIESGGLQGTWAPELLQLSTGLQKASIKVLTEDLLEESTEFQSYVEDQTKLLESSQKLLETTANLEPYLIYGEKPEDFYNRTVHFGNIGTLGVSAVSSYVDLALILPTVNDTLRGPLNGLESI